MDCKYGHLILALSPGRRTGRRRTVQRAKHGGVQAKESRK
jgi:hypothetical protein